MNAEQAAFELEVQDDRLQLRALHRPAYGAIFADWNTPDLNRRIRAGRRQPLARALGLHKRADSKILDATGGLGRDAFVLASLGAQITLTERNATIVELLRDAHRRALRDPETAAAATRIEIMHTDARTLVARGCLWDAAYLDPMYPDDGKTALPSKEMQILRELTGGDADADALLPALLHCARLRVAVKRPLKAPSLAGIPASTAIRSTQLRFDIYSAKLPLPALSEA
jgi:16S rRNA (guanine1516-N2)-methyltransferase